MTKTCARCGLDKPVAEFGLDRAHVKSRCRSCLAELARDRRERPEVKARIKITDHSWKAANLDRRRSYDRSDAKRAAALTYKDSPEGRERRRVNEARRRARKAEVVSDLTIEEWNQILAAFGWACAYCLCRNMPLQMDHVRPLSKGGSHTRDNVVPACPDCNKSKANKELIQFLAAA